MADFHVCRAMYAVLRLEEEGVAGVLIPPPPIQTPPTPPPTMSAASVTIMGRRNGRSQLFSMVLFGERLVVRVCIFRVLH